MEIYNKLKTVPGDALKTIQAGRLKGKSDINPQWRYEKMTEVFGPCGIGWTYEQAKVDFRPGSDGQIAVFVDINLFVKQDGEWSRAIPGTGGSMFVTNEKNGPYTSDEAIKMATTDALSTAMKMLGMAADVYRGLLDTKYSQPEQVPRQPAKAPTTNGKIIPTEKAWKQALEKLSIGEVDKEQIKQALKLTEEQIKELDAK